MAPPVPLADLSPIELFAAARAAGIEFHARGTGAAVYRPDHPHADPAAAGVMQEYAVRAADVIEEHRPLFAMAETGGVGGGPGAPGLVANGGRRPWIERVGRALTSDSQPASRSVSASRRY